MCLCDNIRDNFPEYFELPLLAHLVLYIPGATHPAELVIASVSNTLLLLV